MNQLIRQFRLELNKIDIGLLVFLVLFLNVKLLVKLLAIAFIYLIQPVSRRRFRFNISSFPMLFPALALIAAVNGILFGYFTQQGYWLVFITGLGFWLACFLASQQAWLFAELKSGKILPTLTVFYLINALISIGALGMIILETGAVNPYTYQGNFQKYFIGTGDYIRGISFDTSTANAAINAFGIFYFLEKKKWWMLFVCIACLLLTGSNLVNFLVLLCLLMVFLFRAGKDQKSIIALCIIPMIIFWARVSPQNNNYITTTFKKIFNKAITVNPKEKEIPLVEMSDHSLTPAQRKEKFARLYLDSISKILSKELEDEVVRKENEMTIFAAEEKPLVPSDNIHSPRFQHKDDTTETRNEWMQFASANGIKPEPVVNKRWPGKLLALQQTGEYLATHPEKILTGAGMGNFSSKLAFKATALNIAGFYPAGIAYIHPSFEENHLALYLSFFIEKQGLHSVINTPNSVIDQVTAEYGLLGIGSFLFLYLGFFIKKYRQLSYGIPMLVFMAGMFFTDYWFEQLSIVFLFELFMFLNIKESTMHAK